MIQMALSTQCRYGPCIKNFNNMCHQILNVETSDDDKDDYDADDYVSDEDNGNADDDGDNETWT